MYLKNIALNVDGEVKMFPIGFVPPLGTCIFSTQNSIPDDGICEWVKIGTIPFTKDSGYNGTESVLYVYKRNK